jgi:excisionase family DNA binding protein
MAVAQAPASDEHLFGERRRLSYDERYLLDMYEVAELFGVSYWTVRRLVLGGRLPHIRVGTPTLTNPQGRSIRIPRSAAFEFAAIDG